MFSVHNNKLSACITDTYEITTILHCWTNQSYLDTQTCGSPDKETSHLDPNYKSVTHLLEVEEMSMEPLNSIQFNSIQFSLFPTHVNILYNNDNVHIMCRKRGEQKTVLMNVRPLTITVVNYEHTYH